MNEEPVKLSSVSTQVQSPEVPLFQHATNYYSFSSMSQNDQPKQAETHILLHQEPALQQNCSVQASHALSQSIRDAAQNSAEFDNQQPEVDIRARSPSFDERTNAFSQIVQARYNIEHDSVLNTTIDQ